MHSFGCGPKISSKDATLQSSTTTWNYTASQDGEILYFAVFQGGSGILITTVDPTTTNQNNGVRTTTATCQGWAQLTFTNTPGPVLKTLTGLTINFYTGAENKDPTTEITATLTKSDGTLVH